MFLGLRSIERNGNREKHYIEVKRIAWASYWILLLLHVASSDDIPDFLLKLYILAWLFHLTFVHYWMESWWIHFSGRAWCRIWRRSGGCWCFWQWLWRRCEFQIAGLDSSILLIQLCTPLSLPLSGNLDIGNTVNKSYSYRGKVLLQMICYSS